VGLCLFAFGVFAVDIIICKKHRSNAIMGACCCCSSPPGGGERDPLLGSGGGSGGSSDAFVPGVQKKEVGDLRGRPPPPPREVVVEVDDGDSTAPFAPAGHFVDTGGEPADARQPKKSKKAPWAGPDRLFTMCSDSGGDLAAGLNFGSNGGGLVRDLDVLSVPHSLLETQDRTLVASLVCGGRARRSAAVFCWDAHRKTRRVDSDDGRDDLASLPVDVLRLVVSFVPLTDGEVVAAARVKSAVRVLATQPDTATDGVDPHLDRSEPLLARWSLGGRGAGPGQFESPWFISSAPPELDPAGLLLVPDRENNRVQALDPATGKPMWEIAGVLGARAAAILPGGDARVAVSEGTGGRVSVWQVPRGGSPLDKPRLVGRVGQFGAGPDCFTSPHGMDVLQLPLKDKEEAGNIGNGYLNGDWGTLLVADFRAHAVKAVAVEPLLN
jgi:hypothetical protein